MITCMDYEREECVHGVIKRFKGQYFPANINVWIRDLDMEYVTAVRVEMSMLRRICGVTR